MLNFNVWNDVYGVYFNRNIKTSMVFGTNDTGYYSIVHLNGKVYEHTLFVDSSNSDIVLNFI